MKTSSLTDSRRRSWQVSTKRAIVLALLFPAICIAESSEAEGQSPDAEPNESAPALSGFGNGAFSAAFSNALTGASVLDPRLFGFAPGDVLPALDDCPKGFSRATDERFLRSINLPAADGTVFEWIGPEEKRLRNRGDSEPFVLRDSDDASFDSVRLIVDDTSNKVVRVCCHKRVRGLNVPPPDLLVSLDESLFDRFGSCETTIDGDCWQSGRIWRVWFFPNDETGIVLSYHEQFGIDLELFENEGLFAPKWPYKILETVPEERFGPDMRQPCFHPLFFEYSKRRSPPREIVRTTLGLADFRVSRNRFRLATTGSFHFRFGTNDWTVRVRFPVNFRIVQPQSCAFEIYGPGPTETTDPVANGFAEAFDSQDAAFTAMLDRVADEGLPVSKAARSYVCHPGFSDLCLTSQLAGRFRAFAIFGNLLVELKNNGLGQDSGEGINADCFSNPAFLSRVFAEIVTPESPLPDCENNAGLDGSLQAEPPDWAKVGQSKTINLQSSIQTIRYEFYPVMKRYNEQLPKSLTLHSFGPHASAFATVRNHGAACLKDITPPAELDSGYEEILSRIADGTNRVEKEQKPSFDNSYEIVWSIFQDLPPRTCEEPNAWETWQFPSGRIGDSLAWIPRELAWIEEYFSNAGSEFSFVPIRDRLEHHLAAVNEIRQARIDLRQILNQIDIVHFTNCTNLFWSEYIAATNLLACGKDEVARSALYPVECMMTEFGINDDGRYDEFLLRINEIQAEYERKAYLTVSSWALSNPGSYLGPFRQRILKKPPISSDLSRSARDREYAKDAISYAKREMEHGRWKDAITFLRIARTAIQRNLTSTGESSDEQRQFVSLLGEVDETERSWIAGRVELECSEAARSIARGQYVMGLRSVDCLETIIRLVNPDNRYDAFLARLGEVRTESRRVQDSKSEERRRNGMPF